MASSSVVVQLYRSLLGKSGQRVSRSARGSRWVGSFKGQVGLKRGLGVLKSKLVCLPPSCAYTASDWTRNPQATNKAPELAAQPSSKCEITGWRNDRDLIDLKRALDR